ncbi:hypothetical protein [Bacteroides sp.]|uniref:hypothetical protein n=1 Tax=Bacteroides sp. TaxID=29523 RepID=UPI002583E224|nr:hypothetical protein [Bacteroides sp.]
MEINKELDKLCMEHFQDRAYVSDGIFYGSAANLWNDINPKVLFILKQPNSDELLGEDYREYDFETCSGEQVWRELIGRMYGIMNTTEKIFPDYNKAIDTKTLEETFKHYPFAVINIIKDIGAGTTSTGNLKKYAIENINFLRRQLDILQPNIIVCCGTGVFDIMNQVITPSIESNGNWLKYNRERNIIFFDTYHPGKPNTFNTLKEAYERPLEEYSYFKRNNTNLHFYIKEQY